MRPQTGAISALPIWESDRVHGNGLGLCIEYRAEASLVNIHSVFATQRQPHSPENLHSAEHSERGQFLQTHTAECHHSGVGDNRKSLEVNGDSALEVWVITSQPCKRRLIDHKQLPVLAHWAKLWTLRGIPTETSTHPWTLLTANFALYLPEICFRTSHPLFPVLLNLFWVGVMVPKLNRVLQMCHPFEDFAPTSSVLPNLNSVILSTQGRTSPHTVPHVPITVLNFWLPLRRTQTAQANVNISLLYVYILNLKNIDLLTPWKKTLSLLPYWIFHSSSFNCLAVQLSRSQARETWIGRALNHAHNSSTPSS